MVKRWVVLAIVMLVACKKGEDPTAAFRAKDKPAGGAGSAAPVAVVADAATTAGSGSAGSATAGTVIAAAAGSAASAASEGYKVGDPVYGMWTNGNWYPGKIGKINDDGTYRVNYNDGDVSPSLPLKKIKPRKKSSGGGGGTTTASKGGAEPCPASHWTRCGDGNCHPLMDDRWNCGACGHACPNNMSICRNGTCDCTGVEKDSNGGVCPP